MGLLKSDIKTFESTPCLAWVCAAQLRQNLPKYNVVVNIIERHTNVLIKRRNERSFSSLRLWFRMYAMITWHSTGYGRPIWLTCPPSNKMVSQNHNTLQIFMCMFREIVMSSVLPGRLAWWRHQMETFSACAESSAVTSEFPAQRPVTRSFGVFLDLRLNKRLSKQSWDWWRNRAYHDVIVMGNSFSSRLNTCSRTDWAIQDQVDDKDTRLTALTS